MSAVTSEEKALEIVERFNPHFDGTSADHYRSRDEMIAVIAKALADRPVEDVERRIVEWLRNLVANNDADDRFGPPILIDNRTVTKIADAIESGKHRLSSTPKAATREEK